MIEAKNKHYFETTGFSMWPFLRQQDRIIVEEATCSDLNSGDLIVYKLEGKSVCHRLVKKRISAGRCFLLTRGDYAPSWKTEKVDPMQVTGRVSTIVRGSRIITVKGAWQTFTGRMIILFFPVVVLTFSSLRKILQIR